MALQTEWTAAVVVYAQSTVPVGRTEAARVSCDMCGPLGPCVMCGPLGLCVTCGPLGPCVMCGPLGLCVMCGPLGPCVV